MYILLGCLSSQGAEERKHPNSKEMSIIWLNHPSNFHSPLSFLVSHSMIVSESPSTNGLAGPKMSAYNHANMLSWGKFLFLGLYIPYLSLKMALPSFYYPLSLSLSFLAMKFFFLLKIEFVSFVLNLGSRKCLRLDK